MNKPQWLNKGKIIVIIVEKIVLKLSHIRHKFLHVSADAEKPGRVTCWLSYCDVHLTVLPESLWAVMLHTYKHLTPYCKVLHGFLMSTHQASIGPLASDLLDRLKG